MSILDFFSDMDGGPDDSGRALRFRDLWTRSRIAKALLDANGIDLDANPAYCRLYGYEPSEVLFHRNHQCNATCPVPSRPSSRRSIPV